MVKDWTRIYGEVVVPLSVEGLSIHLDMGLSSLF